MVFFVVDFYSYLSLFFFPLDHFKLKVAVHACPHGLDVGALYEYCFALNGLHLP